MAHASKHAQQNAVWRAKKGLPKNEDLRKEVLEILQGELEDTDSQPTLAEKHDKEAAELVLEWLGSL